MTLNEARKEGILGFKAGRKSAPALNIEFVKKACASKTKTAKLLEAYSRGWSIANLADGVTDETMPSVIEYKKIMAA